MSTSGQDSAVLQYKRCPAGREKEAAVLGGLAVWDTWIRGSIYNLGSWSLGMELWSGILKCNRGVESGGSLAFVGEQN